MQSIIVWFVFLITYGHATDIWYGFEDCLRQRGECSIQDGDTNITLKILDYDDKESRAAFPIPNHNEESGASCQLCTVYRRNLMPTMLKEGNKIYYVNATNHPQHITYTSCYGPQEKSKCKQDLMDGSNGYESTCVQKSTMLNLLGYDETDKKMVRKKLSYPSSCDCVIRPISE